MDTWGQPRKPWLQSHGAAKTICITGSGEQQSRRAENQTGFSLGGSKLQLCLFPAPDSLAHCRFSPSSPGIQAGIAFSQQLHVRSKPLSLPHCGLLIPHHIPLPPNRAAQACKENEDGAGALSPSRTSWTRNRNRAMGRLELVSLRDIMIAKQQTQNLASAIHIFIFFML